MKKSILFIALLAGLKCTVVSAQAGNVGINTSAPGSTLDVNGSFAATYNVVSLPNYAVSPSDFFISYNGTSDGVFTLPASVTGTGSFKGRVYTIKNNTPFNITVTPAGSEKINGSTNITIAANQSLQLINTGLTGSATTWEGTITNNSITASNGLTISGADVRLGGLLSQGTTITNNGNALNINGTAFGTTFSSSGAVGIGTSSPVGRFHIASPDFGAYNGLRIEDTSGANAAIFTITPGYLHSTPCGTCVTLDFSGEGYIGFTDHIVPSLDGIFSSGVPTNRWSAIYAVNGVIQTSDLRLKKDIQNTQYGLEAVMKMRPVEYNWKDGKGKHMVGFIAQEMEKIIPEAVEKPKGNEENYGMNYNQLIPVLTRAIQEQQNMILRQQDIIDKQNIENKNLMNEIEQIKKKIGL